MSRTAVIELWAGVDAYAKEIADFFRAVGRHNDEVKVLAVEQLLQQCVSDGNALHATCIQFVHVITDRFRAIDEQAQRLLNASGQFTTWLAGLLVRYEMGNQEEQVTEEIDRETGQAYAKIADIKNAAAECAKAAGVDRTGAERHGASTMAESDDEYSETDDEDDQENAANV